jgi:hypothetical protein
MRPKQVTSVRERPDFHSESLHHVPPDIGQGPREL